ncbi:MAG: hypothetical protein ABJA75_04790 [Bradyrhizobium sp.]
MINLRLAVPAILAAAAVAAGFTYFVTPSAHVEAEPPLRPTMSSSTSRPDRRAGASPGVDQHQSKEGKTATAYQQAAEAILRRAENALADARTDASHIVGPVPLPRKRPLTRP